MKWSWIFFDSKIGELSKTDRTIHFQSPKTRFHLRSKVDFFPLQLSTVFKQNHGYNDVGDLKLVINFVCWWRDLNLGDIFRMLLPGCYYPTLMLGDRECWCHQHIPSPTSITNIDIYQTRFKMSEDTKCHKTSTLKTKWKRCLTLKSLLEATIFRLRYISTIWKPFSAKI